MAPTRHRIWAAVAMVTAALLATPSARADEASARLARYNKPLDAAIDRGLKYLATAQNDDGSFPGKYGPTTAVVALAGMAFLAKGHTPVGGPYATQINRCIDYVLTHQNRNGCIERGQSRGPMYAHCISTLLLSEASGMVGPDRQKRIDQALPKALKVILAAQQVRKPSPHHQGGWRYKPDSRDSDISVSGWALMALRSARLNGAGVPTRAIDDAIGFILHCRDDRTGGFTYQPGSGGAGFARTGVALLCLELAGRHGEKITTQAGDFLLHALQGGRLRLTTHPYYTLYYCSQGMFQLGGDYWERWAEVMYAEMLGQQNGDGSWGPEFGGARRGRFGVAGQSQNAYATAMTILAMTVSYRQLPIYQR